jgi:hypothetical protein
VSNLEVEWVVLDFKGVKHVVPYFGDEMAGWHDPKPECACGTKTEDGVVIHQLAKQ